MIVPYLFQALRRIRLFLGPFALVALGLVSCRDLPTQPAEENALGPLPSPSFDEIVLPGGLEWGECGILPVPTIGPIQICLPSPEAWEVTGRGLVVLALGYVSPFATEVPDYTVGGRPVSEIVTDLGFAFVTAALGKPGLPLPGQGEAILAALPGVFASSVAPPGPAYLVGPSEGGVFAARVMERAQPVMGYDGGMLLCAPLGSFQGQLRYLGDFAVVFDYLLRGTAPDFLEKGGVWPFGPHYPDAVEQILMWEVLESQIALALQTDPDAADLFRVTGVALDRTNPTASAASAAADLMKRNVEGTADAQLVLQGNPFGNLFRKYRGSSNDWALNRGVLRFEPTLRSLSIVREHYETSGRLTVPAVQLHNTGDPMVPYWQKSLYVAKVLLRGRIGKLISLPVFSYGHCNFTEGQLLFGFWLLTRASGNEMALPAAAFSRPSSVSEFLDLATERGVRPEIR